MAIKVGINGFGRIGKVAFRAAQQQEGLEIAAINIRNADLEYIAYMIKYDTVFGRFQGTVEVYDQGVIVNGKKVRVFSESDAAAIPWAQAGVEYVIEATGAFTTTEAASKHLIGGAKKVVISAPAKDDTPTFVMGVNHMRYTSDMNVVSNASCTTNCLAPLAKVMNDHFGIEEGLMSTIHSSTAKQKTVDCRSAKDWRTGRSVFGNIIPSTTGAAKAVGLVIPELQGKLTGISYRIPAADVSVVDLNLHLKNPTDYVTICKVVKEASETTMKNIIEYVDDEVVSADFIGDANTSIFDARQGIMLNDRFCKLVSFYDNEFGYSSKILMLIKHMASVDHNAVK